MGADEVNAIRTILPLGVLLVAGACGGGGGGDNGAIASPPSSAVTQPTDAPTTTGGPAVTDPPTATDAVSIQKQAFGPKAVTVKVGQTVTWTNKETDGDSHTVTFDAGDVRSPVLAPDATYAHTFTTPGTFAYHCSIHADMHGVVVVTA